MAEHWPKGVNCLALLLTYKEAADIGVNHADPHGTLIEVPDDKGQVVTKPFGECSVEQISDPVSRRRKQTPFHLPVPTRASPGSETSSRRRHSSRQVAWR